MEIIFSCIFSVLFSSIFFYIILKHFNYKKIVFFIEKYPNYILFLEDIMNKSYELVYNDKIRPYSMEGMRLDEGLYALAIKEYNNLVYNLIGPNIKKHLVEVYGDESTFIRFITLHFTTKYENDKIRSAVSDEIINNDEI